MDLYDEYSRGLSRRPDRSQRVNRRGPDESTGAEAEFLRSLVDSRAQVTVVLKSGERLTGRIRYADRDCFSIHVADRLLNVFLRKDSVLYISEE